MTYILLRMLAAFFSGAILSQTGSFIQIGTRNILASPSTLGFDGLAILWLLVLHSVFLAFKTDATITSYVLLGLPCFIFLGWFFAKNVQGPAKFQRVILLGLTFNLLVGAIFSIWQFFFMAFNLPFPMELWFGHFRYVNLEALLLLIGIQAAIILGMCLFWRQLQLSSLGSSLCLNWQLQQKKLNLFIFLAVALGTFGVVALFGAFSFLGLIFPLVARKLWFRHWDLQGELIWGSFFNGLVLMAFDLCCYYFPIWGAEVPVGMIMTAVGAMTLILILWKASESLANSTK